MKRLFVLGLTSLLAATAAYAHHSFAKEYAEEKQISLEGDVVSFEYRNPHAWVYFTASDGTGVLRKYGAEWANPRRLVVGCVRNLILAIVIAGLGLGGSTAGVRWRVHDDTSCDFAAGRV